MMSGSVHVTAAELRRYLENTPQSDDEIDRIAGHLAECAKCQDSASAACEAALYFENWIATCHGKDSFPQAEEFALSEAARIEADPRRVGRLQSWHTHTTRSSRYSAGRPWRFKVRIRHREEASRPVLSPWGSPAEREALRGTGWETAEGGAEITVTEAGDLQLDGGPERRGSLVLLTPLAPEYGPRVAEAGEQGIATFAGVMPGDYRVFWEPLPDV
jgi:hypothetical protein